MVGIIEYRLTVCQWVRVALFTAVLETEEALVAPAVLQAAPGAVEPCGMVLAGAEAWLQLAAHDPVVRRIALRAIIARDAHRSRADSLPVR